MGANIANEVALESFCESTLGCLNPQQSALWLRAFHRPWFRVTPVTDVRGVELCGALKNVVALAAGFSDGLEKGDNTKAAVMRLGLVEMMHFVEHYTGDLSMGTFLESCGVADLITTCAGGRNHRLATQMVKTGKNLDRLEEELLGGQKLQGPGTCKDAVQFIKQRDLTTEFPLFMAVHAICFEGANAESLFEFLESSKSP